MHPAEPARAPTRGPAWGPAGPTAGAGASADPGRAAILRTGLLHGAESQAAAPRVRRPVRLAAVALTALAAAYAFTAAPWSEGALLAAPWKALGPRRAPRAVTPRAEAPGPSLDKVDDHDVRDVTAHIEETRGDAAFDEAPVAVPLGDAAFEEPPHLGEHLAPDSASPDSASPDPALEAQPAARAGLLAFLGLGVLTRKGKTLSPVMPCGDELDRRILKLALPAIVNYLILPFTQAVDLFYIGKLGTALAVAGQAAANQVFSTSAWLTSVIPTVTAPRVARAKARGDTEEVQKAIGEALFFATVMSSVVALCLSYNRVAVLLAAGSPTALVFSLPYLTMRLPGLVLDAFSTVGFASFRGVVDTVTPLIISAWSSALNAVLDPLLMFKQWGPLPGMNLGIAGAALATTGSQLFTAGAFLFLLLRRNMVRWKTLLRPPPRSSFVALARAGGAVQVRALALNAALFFITKTTQTLDSTGTAAAAHAVTIQFWQLGGVILFALSTVAAILVPAEQSKSGGGRRAARAMADRLLAWAFLAGLAIGAGQLAMLPLLGAFTPLPEVQRAAYLPSILGAVLQCVNGLTFVAEGVMVGTGSYLRLAVGQVVATAAIILALYFTPLGKSLPGVWYGFWLFNGVRFVNAMWHHLVSGPLANYESSEPASGPASEAERASVA